MKNWMAALALHYEEVKRLYPNDRLLLLFDIDGTIDWLVYLPISAILSDKEILF